MPCHMVTGDVKLALYTECLFGGSVPDGQFIFRGTGSQEVHIEESALNILYCNLRILVFVKLLR